MYVLYRCSFVQINTNMASRNHMMSSVWMIVENSDDVQFYKEIQKLRDVTFVIT